MNQWAAPLGVALIGATATLTSAYAAYAKDRKNQRAIILQDLEIAAKLPDDSQAGEILRTYAERRALFLPLETYYQWLARREIGFFMLTTGVSLGVALWSQATGISYIRLYFGVFCLLGGVLFLPWTVYRRRRADIVNHYVTELDINPNTLGSMEELYYQSHRHTFWPALGRLWSWLKRKWAGDQRSCKRPEN